MSETPYRSIAAAAAFSPRFHQVLAEANRVRARFDASLGHDLRREKDAATVQKFADAIAQLKLPADSLVHYEEGDPGDLHSRRGAQNEGSICSSRAPWKRKRCIASFSATWPAGSSREAVLLGHAFYSIRSWSQNRSATLFSWRNIPSTPRARCVAPCVWRSRKIASVFTSFATTPASTRPARRGAARAGQATARTLEEEEIALQEFILAAGATPVPIEARCIRGNTGFAASNFVQAVEANLLVVPWKRSPNRNPNYRARIAWVTDVIPCNLWIVR